MEENLTVRRGDVMDAIKKGGYREKFIEENDPETKRQKRIMERFFESFFAMKELYCQMDEDGITPYPKTVLMGECIDAIEMEVVRLAELLDYEESV